MQVSIMGLGYVGCGTAACLAAEGHEVLGVDINPVKVEMLNSGKSPIIEKGIEDKIHQACQSGSLKATTDAQTAVLTTEISLICVGTPSKSNGSLDLSGIKIVSQQIGEALSRKEGYHCIVYRSTVLPGTVRDELIPILTRASKKEVHRDFDVCFNPEFLREGTAVYDFYNPPFSIIGQETQRGGDVVAKLYNGIKAPITRTTYEVAEVVKYACNAFHAAKVIFSNEIGTLCKSFGIDSHQVMELFSQDTKLNISSAYLKPGFAFGGSCLGKDLRALLYRAKQMDIDTPLLSSLLPSNRIHGERPINWILNSKKKKIGILGLSFKQGTDDLRESPYVNLIEILLGKGFQVQVYDKDVLLAKLFGANKAYIEKEIPHISNLISPDLEQVIQEAEVVVVCKPEEEFRKALKPFMGQKIILDLARISPDVSDLPENYEGICW